MTRSASYAAHLAAHSEPGFMWDDALILGHGEMDAIHRQFACVLDELLRSSDAALAQSLENFIAHAQEHFGDEERQMRETRYSGASLGYQTGAIFGGAFAPLIATGLLAATGTSQSIGFYLTALSAVSFFSVRALQEPRHAQL